MNLSQKTPTSPVDSSTAADAQTPRRSFLFQAVTAVISTLIVVVPSAIGGLFFLDPLLRNRKKSESTGEEANEKTDADGFIRLSTTASSLPPDGKPTAANVITNLDDAWSRFMDVPIGSVWLLKTADGTIRAFNSICPHLGCSVNYRSSDNDFFCPCHTSSFDLEGTRTNEVPPRDMDQLEIRRKTAGREDPEGEELWVKFVNYRRATAEKIPL